MRQKSRLREAREHVRVLLGFNEYATRQFYAAALRETDPGVLPLVEGVITAWRREGKIKIKLE